MYDVGAFGRFNGGNRLNFVRREGICVCITLKSEKLLNDPGQIVVANSVIAMNYPLALLRPSQQCVIIVIVKVL